MTGSRCRRSLPTLLAAVLRVELTAEAAARGERRLGPDRPQCCLRRDRWLELDSKHQPEDGSAARGRVRGGGDEDGPGARLRLEARVETAGAFVGNGLTGSLPAELGTLSRLWSAETGGNHGSSGPIRQSWAI